VWASARASPSGLRPATLGGAIGMGTAALGARGPRIREKMGAERTRERPISSILVDCDIGSREVNCNVR